MNLPVNQYAPPPMAMPPNSRFPTWGKWAIAGGCGCPIAVFASLFALGAVGSIFGKSEPEPMKEIPPRVEALDLTREFAADAAEATGKYAGEKVWVGGTIERVGRDAYDFAYVDLTGRNSWCVRCFFADEKRMTGLKVGAQVTIEGECAGPDFSPRLNVRLFECRVVPPGLLPPEKK